ncbi:MAG: FdtA/QdtA family cupin domain-containing protein [Treponema sp.]|nr:FdtA/QdtA family cupin domain-containing protein [Treponema sp.]
MESVHMVEFPQKGDERGHLVIVEGNIDIPFEIKRIFYIYGSDKDVVRGKHANRKSEFILINLAGSSKVKVKDGKGNEAIFCLNRPHTGIYLPKLIWKDMYDFSKDSVLLCLSSEHYDADEYIRDYDEFVKIINGK